MIDFKFKLCFTHFVEFLNRRVKKNHVGSRGGVYGSGCGGGYGCNRIGGNGGRRGIGCGSDHRSGQVRGCSGGCVG